MVNILLNILINNIFHPYLMGLKTPSQLYMEGNAGNFLTCKVKADSRVNFALESQLSRESHWARKSSTITECQSIIEKVSENMMLPMRENCYNYDASLSHQLPKLKEAVRQEVQFNYLEKWNSRVKDLVVQGDFLNLLVSEKSNVSWRSIIYGVPKGVMQFAMRASTNTLATPDNLKRWKVSRSDTCKMCLSPTSRPQKATLFHILNNCNAFL